MSGRVLIAAGTVETAAPYETVLRQAFDTAIATRADDVLALCSADACDVVLIDATAPASDAPALCRRIRDVAPRVMVVASTASDEPLRRLRVLDAGADEALSWPAAGSTILLRMHSLMQAAALEREAAGLPALSGPSPHGAREGSTRIIVLDPCDGSRSRLADILAPLGTVAAFADAGLGLIAAAEACPDLALVSLDWPDRPGDEIARHLQRVVSGERLSVLGIASGDELSARSCLEAGVQDRLLRPIDRSEVLLRARLALRKARLSADLRGGEAPPVLPALHPFALHGRRRRPLDKFAA